jgi:endoglucanase
VILDEFGALGFCSDAASRAGWIRAVRQAAEADGIGWAYWELDYGFGFIRNRQSTEGFDRPVIEALLG